mgnify:CR=1 FL=1
MDTESEDLLKEFVAESSESLGAIEQTLLTLETNGSSKDIDEIFRAIHSVKGAAGFFQLTGIERISHNAETLLEKIRSSEIPVTADIVDLLLRARDTLWNMLFEPDFGNDLDIDGLVRDLKHAWSGLSDTARKDTEQPVLDEKGFPPDDQDKKALPGNGKSENQPEEKKKACPALPQM